MIMMLVSYRPLAAGVLLALLERYVRADRGDEGSVGPTALNPFYSGLEGEMPAIARPREALWRPYASPATVAEPAPPTPPKEREKRDSLLCDGDTVDAVLGSVFD